MMKRKYYIKEVLYFNFFLNIDDAFNIRLCLDHHLKTHAP